MDNKFNLIVNLDIAKFKESLSTSLKLLNRFKTEDKKSTKMQSLYKNVRKYRKNNNSN